MATVTNGTLILRPDASRGTGITTTPSGTSVDECYKLVNEETADYESTYLTLADSASIFFHFSLPEGVKITAFDSSSTIYVKGVARDFATLPSDVGNLDIESGTENLCLWSDETNLGALTFLKNMNDENNNTALQPISSSVVLMTNEIVDALHNDDLAYGLSFTYDDSADKLDMRLSQIYLEINNVSYQEVADSALSIFLKQNGSWSSIAGTLFQKQNGTWIECDTSVLTDGTQYAFKEL